MWLQRWFLFAWLQLTEHWSISLSDHNELMSCDLPHHHVWLGLLITVHFVKARAPVRRCNRGNYRRAQHAMADRRARESLYVVGPVIDVRCSFVLCESLFQTICLSVHVGLVVFHKFNNTVLELNGESWVPSSTSHLRRCLPLFPWAERQDLIWFKKLLSSKPSTRKKMNFLLKWRVLARNVVDKKHVLVWPIC